jgi:AraC-like DNA-binding protein
MARQLSVAAVCDLINALLHQGYPAIDDIARLLCISPRTLQRQLNEAGASYKDSSWEPKQYSVHKYY